MSFTIEKKKMYFYKMGHFYRVGIIVDKGRKSIVFLLFVLTFFRGFTQLVFERTTIDFGDLTNESERFQDILIMNIGSKKEYVLNYKAPREVFCLFNTQAAVKDSTLLFRIQPNPKKIGSFSYEIILYTSDKEEPTILIVKGYLREIIEDPLAKLQSCPTFNDRPSVHATDFKLTVITKDKITGSLLAETTVSLIQNGLDIGRLHTNQEGKVSKEVPLGFIYFYASKKGYFSAEVGSYVNIQSNKITLYLNRDSLYNIYVNKEDTINNKLVETNKLNKYQQVDSTLNIESSLRDNISQDVVLTPIDSLPIDQFDSRHFKPLNVTFVIDISSSMKIGDRLELMKYSLHQLSNILRPEDQLSIVSYASEAEVLLNTTSGDKKEKLKTAISSIKAGGMTAGGEGIKLGCKLNAKSLNTDGENLIYIITDGAFNKDSKTYMESIDKYKEMGIRISVIGIQNIPHDAISMQKVASLGGGDYISIQRLADAEKALIYAVRKECYRK